MTPTHTLEEEFDFVCKSAGLTKLLVSPKPTWLTKNKSEGVELDGKVVRMFNNEKGERAYKDAPGSKLQVIIDAFKVPPAPEVKHGHDEKEHQEKKEGKDAKVEEHKTNAPEVKGEVKKMEQKTEDKGLVSQEKVKSPAKLSDHEIEEKIERAKARRYTSGQGDFYKVQGKERPDAAMIQKLANESGISIEITKAEQTDKYAHIEVVGILGSLRVPAVVHHDFDTEFLLKTMEIIEKNKGILDHYEGTTPVIKEGAQIKQWDNLKQRDDFVDAKYYLIHTLLSFKKFSLRDACTKAMSIVELKLLNQEFRDEDEIKSEQAETELVNTQKAKAK